MEEEQDLALLNADHLRRILRLYGREDTQRMQQIFEDALNEAEQPAARRAFID